ncbi:hypothetical protein [Actinoplanes sp. NPDC023714]|uniref:hypothetical protein n=1 Tax=Actinoplanes sp. NPDC023714 TaxID=3154322 RepID=UPI0033D5B28D
MTDASVHLAAQPRLDTLVTEFRSDARRLRTDFAGTAWIGDIPDPESGMMGPNYQRRAVDSQLFLPDTHWYTVGDLDDAEIQIAVGLLQVPGTKQGTQGLVGAIADPSADFFEHPEHDDRVGVCLTLRGQIWSNVGLSYRITVLCRPEALISTAPTA